MPNSGGASSGGGMPAHPCPAAEAKVVSLEVVVAHLAGKQRVTVVDQARADRAAIPAWRCCRRRPIATQLS